MKLYGKVIQTISAISAKEGIPLPDLLISIAKRQGMIENMMDTVQSTLFDFVHIVKTVDKQVSIKAAFKVYTVTSSFAKIMRNMVGGMTALMILSKFKSFHKTKDLVFDMLSKIMGLFAIASISMGKVNPKKMAMDIDNVSGLLKKLMEKIIFPLMVPEDKIMKVLNTNGEDFFNKDGKKKGSKKSIKAGTVFVGFVTALV
jgi:hypothetical protein